MNFKTPFKVLTTAALIGTLSLSAVAPSASAQTTQSSTVVKKEAAAHEVTELIYKNKETGALVKLAYAEYEALLADSEEALVEAVKGYELAYILTGNGNVYKFADYEAYLAELDGEETAQSTFGNLDNADKEVEAPAEVVEGSLQDGKLVADEEAAEEDFEVTEVAAITDTAKKGEEQQLSFTVNGEAADLDKLKEAGYTVKYEYTETDKAKFTADGKVKPDADFEYRVVVTPEEGEAKTSEWTKVTVTDAAKATKVTGVQLSNKLDKIAKGETANVTITKAENAFGEEVKAAEIANVQAAIKSVTSSDVTVASVAKDGTDFKVNAKKAGKVTFTVNFTEESKLAPVTYEVEVTAEQEADSIKAEDTKAEKTNTASATDYLTGVKVLDASGEELRTNADVTVDSKYKKVVKAADGTVVSGADIYKEAGKYTVTISSLDDEGEVVKELGSYTIEVVDTASAGVDTFKIVPKAETFEIDVNPSLAVSKTTDVLSVSGYVNDVKVSDVVNKVSTDGYTYTLKSSNKDVLVFSNTDSKISLANATADVSVTGVKAGTATVTLVKSKGAKEEVVASYDVTVKNTVKLVENVTLNADEKAVSIGAESPTQDQLKAAVVAATNLTDVAQIASVEYLADDEKVIVNIDPKYAGETSEFVLDAKDVTATNKATGLVTNVGEISGWTDTNTVLAANDVTVVQNGKTIKLVGTVKKGTATEFYGTGNAKNNSHFVGLAFQKPGETEATAGDRVQLKVGKPEVSATDLTWTNDTVATDKTVQYVHDLANKEKTQFKVLVDWTDTGVDASAVTYIVDYSELKFVD